MLLKSMPFVTATTETGMAKPLSGSQAVEAFLNNHKHPLRDTAAAVVSLIRTADPSLEEGIKWNAPSFKHGGDDRLTLNLSAKDKVRLILHCGAKAGPRRSRRVIDSDSDLLEWASNDRAIISFMSEDEVRDAKRELTAIISSWLAASSV